MLHPEMETQWCQVRCAMALSYWAPTSTLSVAKGVIQVKTHHIGSKAPRPPGATGQSEDQLRAMEGRRRPARPDISPPPATTWLVDLEATQTDKDDETDKDITQTTSPPTWHNCNYYKIIGSLGRITDSNSKLHHPRCFAAIEDGEGNLPPP